MADYTSSSQGGGYSFEHDAGLAPQVAAKPLTKFANFAGAALSITLIVGIGVWGYKLLVRDVTGIPVVRAAQGDMRVRPENPGGQLADNQGLSVNAVASEGTANQFAEQLILAPKPLDLEEEDQPIPVAMVAPAQQAPTQSSPAADVAEALKNGDVDDLVASLTDGVEPLEDEEDGTALPEPINASATMDVDPLEMAVSNAVAVAMGEEPGVRASLRPQTRPGGRAVATKASFEPAP
ncbi:SPOR domain-containing protein, partial [Sulfitobacter pontiacus]|uniref:SPOR domain-containing protein n=2 Tax=Sulfitobacter TaxID=60136 RepID=UPI00241E3F12